MSVRQRAEEIAQANKLDIAQQFDHQKRRNTAFRKEKKQKERILKEALAEFNGVRGITKRGGDLIGAGGRLLARGEVIFRSYDYNLSDEVTSHHEGYGYKLILYEPTRHEAVMDKDASLVEELAGYMAKFM